MNKKWQNFYLHPRSSTCPKWQKITIKIIAPFDKIILHPLTCPRVLCRHVFLIVMSFRWFIFGRVSFLQNDRWHHFLNYEQHWTSEICFRLYTYITPILCCMHGNALITQLLKRPIKIKFLTITLIKDIRIT